MTSGSGLLGREDLDALARRHHIEPENLRAFLDEAFASTATLTAGEQEFLRAAGAPETFFDPAEIRDARVEIGLAVEQSDAEARRGLNTAGVSELLGIAQANVRRLVQQRRLYVAGKFGRENVFPTWQFIDGELVPHLDEVGGALPAGMHPLDVQDFMTTPQELLGNRTPADWLHGGGVPDPVVQLADEKSYT